MGTCIRKLYQLYSVTLEWPLLLGLSNSTCIKHCNVVSNEWTNACLSLQMELSLYSLFYEFFRQLPPNYSQGVREHLQEKLQAEAMREDENPFRSIVRKRRLNYTILFGVL